MDSAVVQMNVRIDSQLKDAGDCVLERAGLSPTRAVRALWERLASFSDAPEKAVELLFPSEGDPVSSIEDERARKLKAAREATQIVARSLAKQGIDASSVADDTPYDELRERALIERLGERGLDQ